LAGLLKKISKILKEHERQNWPQMNADKRRFKTRALIYVYLRSSAADFVLAILLAAHNDPN
jgi:hypothetical protein